MQKIDFRKEWGELYFPSAREVSVVHVPPMNFAMIDGEGDPNRSTAYREGLKALFGVSYTLRFSLKQQGVAEYRVGPLEGLWWTGGRIPTTKRDLWKWTSMIMQPPVVTSARFREAVVQLREREDPPALGKVRLKKFAEGAAAQILHVGPYSAERPTIERLHDFIREHDGRPTGRHHEIYLGDPRRSKPEKLRTVLRQPFRE